MTGLTVSATVLALLSAAVATPLAAQQNSPSGPTEVVDRIVAVVGDSVILESELKQELYREEAARREPPKDTAKLTRQILDQMVDNMVLVEAAVRDSTTVSPTDVQDAVNQDIARRRQSFGSEAQFEEALSKQGLTMAQFKDMLSRQYEQQLMVRQYLNTMRQKRTPPTVTEEEIKKYFDERKAQLGKRPATITFRQVVITPRPSDTARATALKKAHAVLDSLRNGANFATMAKRFSDDPGTKDKGGELGWFRRGEMMPQFERAAFALPPGGISGIVETPYGFHIIKVQKVRGAEREARHILIAPTRSPEDIARAKALADSVKQMLENGTSMDSLVARYSDPSEQSRVGPYPMGQLPASYGPALADAKKGDIVGPIKLTDSSPAKFAIVEVTNVTKAGDYTVDDLRSQIAQQIEQQKVMKEIINDLRDRTYIDIRYPGS